MNQRHHGARARLCFWLLVAASFVACDSNSNSGSAGMDVSVMVRPDAVIGALDAAPLAVDSAVGTVDGAVAAADAGADVTMDAAVEVTDTGRPQGVDANVDGVVADMELAPATCEAACVRVADCLVEVCDGYGAGARRQLNERCLERCTPALARSFSGRSCNEIAESVSEQFPQVAEQCTPQEPGEGMHALYIGHSFGRGFAERMPAWTRNAGVMNHTQDIVFRGGANGAPQALWDNREARAEIQAILNDGDVDVLIMICCSQSFLMDGTDPAIRLWMDYALERNPNTRFALALPWPDFPQNYDSAAAYAGLWNGGHILWHGLIDQLRQDYPEVSITCIPHGRAAHELRTLFEAGELNDVDAMTSGNGTGIFRDRKGHADEILLDLGSLVWLGALYNIDLNGYPLMGYEADLIGLAQTILGEDDRIR